MWTYTTYADRMKTQVMHVSILLVLEVHKSPAWVRQSGMARRGSNEFFRRDVYAYVGEARGRGEGLTVDLRPDILEHTCRIRQATFHPRSDTQYSTPGAWHISNL